MERLSYLLTVVFTILLLLFFSGISQGQTSFNVSNKTTADTLFTIDENGKVGIGTTAPVAKLEVLSSDPDQNGSIRVGTSDLSVYLRLYSGRASFPNPFIMWNEGSALRFGTSFGSEFARLSSEGNLGIGTTTPTEMLEVADTIYSSVGGFKFPDGTVQATAAAGSFWNQSGTDIYFNSGNVGIGTTSPSAPLAIIPGSNDRGIFIDHDLSSAPANSYGISIDVDKDVAGTTHMYGAQISTTNNSGSGITRGITCTVSGTALNPKFGIIGNVSGAGDHYGVYGIATGSGTQYGVYGTASGTGDLWAGYFNGNLFSEGNFLATGTFGDGTIPVEGEGTRMMWYPAKAAFRVGYANGTQWNDVNVGNYSQSLGFNTTASGYASNAMGTSTIASGSYSTAIGYGTTASATYSTAIGNSSESSGQNAVTIGRDLTASGQGSIAMGNYAKARHDGAIVLQASWTGVNTDTISSGTRGQMVLRADGGLYITRNEEGQAPVSSTTLINTSSGAYLSTTGYWIDASSREYKENIQDLSLSSATQTLINLNPVTYDYKVNKEDHRVGFIAEDVPELVATTDRKGLSAMDIVAVLTKVVQNQQREIEMLKQQITQIQNINN